MAEALADEEALVVEAKEFESSVPTKSKFQEDIEEDASAQDELPGFSDLKATKTNATAASGGKPYSVFTAKEKWFIVILSSIAGIFSPIGSNIYVPAIPTMAQAFHVSNEKINLTVTIYLVFQALTPAIWGAAADCYGRRPVYVGILILYVASCLGTALCPTSAYWLLMVMRILQSTGGSAMIAIGAGVIGDIAMPQERGKYFGVFNLGTLFGPAIGPVLGGVFAFTLGWRSIFWFLTIASGIVVVPMVFFFPETLRALVGDGSIPPPLINCTPAMALKRRRQLREMTDSEELPVPDHPKIKFKPWTSLVLAFEPDLSLLFIYASLYYALWYAMLTIFSTLLKDKYNCSEIVIGLAYIPHGLSCGAGSFVTGRMVDRFYKKEKVRVGADHRHRPEEFRLERTRFIVMPPFILLMTLSIISVGWSMQAKASLAVPIVLNAIVGFSTGFLTAVTVYGLDLFPGQGGATTATFNLIRCLLGAVSVSIVQVINTAIGAGWTFVLLSGVAALGTPLPIIVIKYGPGWRLKRMQKAKLKELAREEARRAAERTTSQETSETSDSTSS